jgi:hypothetical protein
MKQSLAAPNLRKRKRTPANDLDIQEPSEDGEEDVSVQNDPEKAELGMRLY